jgi:hypothetical protein
MPLTNDNYIYYIADDFSVPINNSAYGYGSSIADELLHDFWR